MSTSMRLCALLVLISIVACSGSAGTPSSPTPPTPALLSVGGTYGVTKSSLNTSCGNDLASLTATITVDQTPGSLTVAGREGFGTYRGQLSTDGPLRITLREGRFTATVIEGRNVWEMFANGQAQPATCVGELFLGRDDIAHHAQQEAVGHHRRHHLTHP